MNREEIGRWLNFAAQKVGESLTWMSGNGPFKHGALIVLLLVILYGSTLNLFHLGMKMADNWLGGDVAHYEQRCYLYRYDVFEVATETISRELPEWRRLRDQCEHIRRRALLHLNVMIYYSASYFMSTTMGTLLGLIAGVTLFFISRVGWAQANPYVITIFVMMTGSAVFYSTMPIVFQHETNIEANRALHISYADLENQILSYMATGSHRGPDNEGEIEINHFIHVMDQQLGILYKLPLAMKPEAIPQISEFQQLLNSQTTVSSSVVNQEGGSQ